DAPSATLAPLAAPVLAPADVEDGDGTVADDTADRSQGAEAASDEPARGRPAQGALARPELTPVRAPDLARGGGALERGAPARCDFCERAARRLALLGAVGRRVLAPREPARPLRLRDPASRPPRRFPRPAPPVAAHA